MMKIKEYILHADITGTFLSASVLICIVLIALAIERIKPVGHHEHSSTKLNIAYMTMSIFAKGPLASASLSLTVYGANFVGGGLIELPSSGWGIVVGLFIYTLTVDLAEYLFHRTQHIFKPLWVMHSFHHSDQSMNGSTTFRHFWVESGIKSVTIYLVAAMTFKVSPLILTMYAILSLYNIFCHMNVRIGFGRFSMIANSPQYHRLHHSSLPQHYNCNFAAFLPIWDVIFRTYRAPRHEEYPPTGIEFGDQPTGIAEAVLWPARAWLRRATGQRPSPQD